MFSSVCVAGTFDSIHAGHEALLYRAFEVGEQVLIGITSDEHVLRYKVLKSPKVLKSLTERKQNLIGWLAAHGYASDRYEIVPIDDPFEPAASDPRLDALVVSEETRDRGEELNALRKSKNLKPLTLIVIPMVPANGKLVMPESLRSQLVKPLGSVLSGDALASIIDAHHSQPFPPPSPQSTPIQSGSRLSLEARGTIVSVGDVTTKTFLDAGVVPQLMIIDHKVNRKPFSDPQSSLSALQINRLQVVSGPGYISKSAIDAIRDSFGTQDKPMLIEVEGEEDLLVLPVISEAPLGSRIYYGQPARLPSPAAQAAGGQGEGMVEVVVTKQTKKKVIELLKQFV